MKVFFWLVKRSERMSVNRRSYAGDTYCRGIERRVKMKVVKYDLVILWLFWVY